NDEIWSRLLARSNASPRTRKKGRNRAARFALTNRTVAAEDNRLPGALQPNTVALTGPTRTPGKRLLQTSNKGRTGNGSSNFIVDALRDYANTKRAPSSKKSSRLTPGESTAKVSKKIATEPAGAKKPKARDSKHFVQYPAQPAHAACHKNTLGENYLIVTRALKDADKNARFAVARIKALPSGTTQLDCPVYLDIPRHKT
ncbi:MAG: hypothetical protein ACR2O4_08645, partial [Hyphomicrobiaceae bacterium]